MSADTFSPQNDWVRDEFGRIVLPRQRRFRGWRSRSWPIRIRFALLIPGTHRWNGWVRDFTAWMERV